MVQREIKIRYSDLAMRMLIAKQPAATIAAHYGITPAELAKAATDLGIKKSRGSYKPYIIVLENDSQQLLNNMGSPEEQNSAPRVTELAPDAPLAELSTEAATLG